MGRLRESYKMPDPMDQFAHDYGANRLLAAKRARKRAEGDYQLLQNRLVRLKMMEEKASKKIAETRQRAEEIMKLKRRNKKEMDEKMKQALHADDEIAVAKDR